MCSLQASGQYIEVTILPILVINAFAPFEEKANNVGKFKSAILSYEYVLVSK